MNMKNVGFLFYFIFLSGFFKKTDEEMYIIDIENTGCILPQRYAFTLARNIGLSQACHLL